MRRFLSCALLVLALASPRATHAGVTNPDISVIGQPTLAWNDVAGDAASKRPVFNVGETPEISPAFPRVNVDELQDAAGSPRPYHYQEDQCA